jgi:uncharacterized protein
MVKLYDKRVLDYPLTKWHRNAVLAFDKKMMNKTLKFPCIPAYQGYMLNHIRFGFAGDPRHQETFNELADMLKAYGDCSRETGDYSALVVFFETPLDLQKEFSVLDYEHLFWKLLNQVNEKDDDDWLETISPYPEDHTWEFCFNKERYFFYCATPAHEKRKSRHFPFFMLAITPRWVLEKFSSSEEKAIKVKELIRERLIDYDSVPPHPNLKWYGQSDNHEWKQYYLRDDETTMPSCPFKHIWKEKS